MDTQLLILDFLSQQSERTSTEIHAGIRSSQSVRTTKRVLDHLVAKKLVDKKGSYKSTRYSLGKAYRLLHSVDVDGYFAQDVDERTIRTSFNHQLLREDLYLVDIFTDEEHERLAELQATYQTNTADLTPFEYQKEIERLAIDLSWKSSQIRKYVYLARNGATS